MTHTFTAKLDSLDQTVASMIGFDAADIAAGLANGRGKLAVAVGSGGSAVVAEFFSRCRDSLGLGPTIVQTPMEIAVGIHDHTFSDVWLFSAGADNADVVAAAQAALQRRCRSIQIVTRGPSGAAAGIVRAAGGEVHAVPVATEQDGYLATHSLIGSIGALLLASDIVAHDAVGHGVLLDALRHRISESRDSVRRSAIADSLASMSRRDTVILVADPQLRTMATLLETSIWEACLCPIQSTDLRNFAHGRHAWLHHRANETFLIALTGLETQKVWAPLAAILPSEIRQLTIDLADCGRLSNALGVVDGLGLIEGMGQALGIDPAKPGYGAFGPPMYANRSLAVLVRDLSPPVRQKRAAMAQADERAAEPNPLLEISRGRLKLLREATIGGLVLDYDGTLVSTSERYHPPRPEILEQLERLDGAGARIGIATGRGSSAGRDLRAVLPKQMHQRVIVGYYNGGHIATLDIDLDEYPAPVDPIMAEAADWLQSHDDLFVTPTYKVGGLQITIDSRALRKPYRFRRDMLDCPAVRTGRAIVTGSGHSFDIVATTSSKLRVVSELRRVVARGSEILCFGDSGSRTGNDHALLSHPFGISVGEVCGTPDGCWSLFGDHSTGPDALLRALRALLISVSGEIRLDIDLLLLDTPVWKGHIT
jgi:fructoselysine-6-P-deglycase FrlB-like protein